MFNPPDHVCVLPRNSDTQYWNTFTTAFQVDYVEINLRYTTPVLYLTIYIVLSPSIPARLLHRSDFLARLRNQPQKFKVRSLFGSSRDTDSLPPNSLRLRLFRVL
ncbi:hypothetical protein FS749_013426 [Ceratobasidium sp. UAMH 11750]|nr:hypothetical protein FS749_013426 [Ceratobasidium sp. UAMH 11750]